MDPRDDLARELDRIAEESEKYETCMALTVSELGGAVELWLDTSLDTYDEWIKGEGADIALIRCQETKRVVGVRLPLLCDRLCVHHKGPLRINSGFRKDDKP